MPMELALLIVKINNEVVQALTRTSSGPYRKDERFFGVLKERNYQPLSSKYFTESLELKHKFSDKEHPEAFLIELIITLGAYILYLDKKEDKPSQEMRAKILSDVFDLKINEIDLSLKDILFAMNGRYQKYASNLMYKITDNIKAYRKKDWFKMSSEMIEMHSAVVEVFAAAELREQFTFLPRYERHKEKEVLTLNHLENWVKTFLEDSYQNQLFPIPGEGLARQSIEDIEQKLKEYLAQLRSINLEFTKLPDIDFLEGEINIVNTIKNTSRSISHYLIHAEEFFKQRNKPLSNEQKELVHNVNTELLKLKDGIEAREKLLSTVTQLTNECKEAASMLKSFQTKNELLIKKQSQLEEEITEMKEENRNSPLVP